MGWNCHRRVAVDDAFGCSGVPGGPGHWCEFQTLLPGNDLAAASPRIGVWGFDGRRFNGGWRDGFERYNARQFSRSEEGRLISDRFPLQWQGLGLGYDAGAAAPFASRLLLRLLGAQCGRGGTGAGVDRRPPPTPAAP